MSKKNRYKFVFGDKPLTLTTDKDNLFMEEVERIATEKYQAIKDKLPNADNETLAILLAINCLSTQLSREIECEKIENENEELKNKLAQLTAPDSAVNEPLLESITTGEES